MRNEQKMINSFMPIHEKEYEARLFIDEAIKGKVEYQLQAMARALSGNNKIRLRYSNNEEQVESIEQVKGDCGTYVRVSKKWAIEARLREFAFYGNNEIQIWLEIINFWAGKTTIFPCGGSFINTETITP